MALQNFIDVDFSSFTSALNAVINYINAKTITKITASGAVPVVGGQSVITDAGIAALTLAAPTTPAQDGLTLEIQSSTAFAHTLTATGLLQTGTASVNVATFAAQAGAGLALMAFNGKWIVKSSVGITFS
jgi:hypothetical protein